jgi:hypothetical protein
MVVVLVRQRRKVRRHAPKTLYAVSFDLPNYRNHKRVML